jgi:hypothetical protein
MRRPSPLGLAENPAVRQFLLQRRANFFLFALSKSNLFTRHPYRGGLAVRLRQSSLATQEVNDVSSLFGDRRTNRCRCGFYWRAGGVGSESVSQKERSRRNCFELK